MLNHSCQNTLDPTSFSDKNIPTEKVIRPTMRYYRRIFVPGATYFFTLNMENRKSDLLTRRIEALRFAFRHVKQNHPFYIEAMVVLPDHCHILMTLPEGDTKYSQRLNLIKGGFSRQISSQEHISKSRKQKRERGIWQRRFWEHTIQNPVDYEHHVNYIHYNPVKHHYVKNPSDWPYSSIHQFIKKGILTPEWAKQGEDLGKFSFGE